MPDSLAYEEDRRRDLRKAHAAARRKDRRIRWGDRVFRFKAWLYHW